MTTTTPEHRSRQRLLSTVLVLTAALLLLPVAAAAQNNAKRVGNNVELTPFLGFVFGGEYEYIDRDFGFTRVEIDESESYGLALDIPVGRSFQVELFYTNQDSNLDITEGIGDLDPDDVELETFHAGVLWQSAAGQVRPFGVLTAGVTKISPGLLEIDSDYQPSVGIGGGVKVMFSEHVGLRLEGRLLITHLDDDFGDDRCCHNDRYYDHYDDEQIVQGLANVGLVFSF